MARIRTIKPEFWQDEKLAPLDPLTRLVFLGLISQADDAGRLVDSVRMLDGLLFPFTDDTCGPSLDILDELDVIERGTTAARQSVIQIVNWKHQKIDKPNLSAALPPIETPRGKRVPDDSAKRRRSVGEGSAPHISTGISDQLSPTAEQGAKRNDGGEHRAACVEFVKANGYGAKEKLMAEGEDGPAWATHTGDRVPWDDRLRLLKLAHARVVDKESTNLRSALRYVIPQQLDPTMAPTSAEFAKRRQDAETPVAAQPANTVTASGEKAKSEAKRAAYTSWKERVRSALDDAGEAVRKGLEREVEESIGEIALRNMPPAGRERAMDDMVLQLYGERIGQPAPAVAA